MRLLAKGIAGAAVLAFVISTAPTAAMAAPRPDWVRRPDATSATLVQRATLASDYQAPGPPSGADVMPVNGVTPPFPGQVIPGFSGIVDAGGGLYWGLPDNGFGAKDNSEDFLLRLYRIAPRWEDASGGAGAIRVGSFISLRDPDQLIDFPIVREGTPDRLLTGGDFDVESVARAADGTFWIGEEFGPFLLHIDSTGKLLEAPVPFPYGKSPQNPYLEPGETPMVRQSRGFEAMAGSPDGRYLYPIVEGSFTNDPELKRRYIYEFDVAARTYTGRRWDYRTDVDANVIGDAVALDQNRLLLIERDDFQGPASVTKRLYLVDRRVTDGAGLAKHLVVDLLKISNPDGIGDAAAGYGLGDPFSFPLQSVEALLVRPDGRILVGNDNNYPGSNGRVPGRPDDTELIVLDVAGGRTEYEDEAPLVIAHRGASGYRPEHTLAAYELAITQCAEYIEPDLVSTRDGVLVARHENEIGGTTDVEQKFPDRQATRVIDGVTVTGWFTEDLTLAELKTLRAEERLPATRPQNTAFNGLYQVPTFEEVLDLARHSVACDGGPVGVYPETKHPTYFDGLNLSMEEELVRILHSRGYDRARSPVFIQSFETANLRDLSGLTRLPLVQLVNCSGQPYDFTASGDPREYLDLVTPEGLAEIATYADGVGVCKDVLIPRDAQGYLQAPTAVVDDAHAQGLIVHGWTFRRENRFLPADFRSGPDLEAPGDLIAEIQVFLDAGMDGFFTDNPDLGAAAVAAEEVSSTGTALPAG